MKHKSRLLLIALLLVAVLVAACGGGESTPTATPTEEAAAQAAETPTAEAAEAEETEAAAEAEETEAAAEAEETEAAAEAEETEAAAEAEATEATTAEEAADIVETAVQSDFTTLIAAVEAAGLAETLAGNGPFTVFAPTDEAFAAALEALGLTTEELLADTETLTNILLYHVAEGEVRSTDLEDGQTITTLQGGDVTVSITDGTVMLNDTATVVLADVEASNGIIHAIDAVLLPPDMVAAMAEPTEEMAMEATEEVAMAEPTEEMAMEATEEVAMAEPTEEMAMEATEEPSDVVEAAVQGDFTILLAALDAAGLTETLMGEGPFTIFAPTDAAFAAALEALGVSAEDLLADTENLTNILLYHVAAGAVMSSDLEDGQVITTLQGSDISISISDGVVMVNETATVVLADVEASNGVIHAIDAVLLPPAEESSAPAASPAEEATPEPTEEAAAAMPEGALISGACMVTDVGGVTDGTFNQLAFNGMTRAGEDFGLEVQVIESSGPSDFEPNINTCIDGGYSAIVTVGFLLADATLAAAEANPDLYFIGVDQFFAEPPANLVGIQTREDQAGFLAGVLAALMTESNTVAGVYGIDIPPVIKFRNGFEQGARYINPDITTLGVYIDSFEAPDRGADAAEQFIGEGADVIFGAGGPTGSGGITFAAQEGVLVIGVDQDEYFTTFGRGESPGAENLIGSAIKKIDIGVYNMLAGLVGADGFEWAGGGLYLLEAANDGVGLAEPHDADVPQEVLDRVNEVFDMLKSGDLETGVDPVTGAMLDAAMEEMEATEEGPSADATPEPTPGS